MNTTYLTGKEDGIKMLAMAVFPGYKGRRYKFQTVTSVSLDGTYWDGGSRSSYGGVNLATGKSAPLPQFDPPQFGGPVSTPKVDVRPGMAVVEHSIFCGKDHGITFYVHPDDAPALIPAPADVTEDEKIVLLFTSTLKNSYGGKSNIRFTEATDRYGISQDAWTAAQDSLKARKLLNKAGSITPDGRNVDTAPYRY